MRRARANSTTFLPPNSSSVVFGFGPSEVITVKVALGTLSPTLIAMASILSALVEGSVLKNRGRNRGRRHVRA